jgi:hypothetical protein
MLYGKTKEEEAITNLEQERKEVPNKLIPTQAALELIRYLQK